MMDTDQTIATLKACDALSTYRFHDLGGLIILSILAVFLLGFIAGRYRGKS